ncbi:glucosyl transferase [Psychromonas sp. MB-3u-54]|uniref:glycosyltransferase family 2 protein n=1 Tax=Psychromonas sp. MB-3u-54 TaxID=2058319 RepID=UPI000C349C5C|nr:glycosyltransferase family A protein [Psychromonas sp. MB-3u-54]PKH03006.1 glucosyl transferase [Psychromonas sp. MB-3u-54]
MNKQSLPIVSVVIPMYNVEDHIQQCIQSVLAQTFQNFEVICVNDGSTDSTLDKLRQFNDPRIRLIQQANRGLSGARNSGILAARGLYVALLDADDFWAHEKLTYHVNHLNSHPNVGVSYCPSLFVNEQGTLMGIGQFPKLKKLTCKDIFCRNPVGNGSAPVIRHRLLREMTFECPKTGHISVFDEELSQSEDIELWLRIALRERWTFEGIDVPLTYYRVNESGLSANVTKQYANWCLAVKKNIVGHEEFFERYLALARAYQLRYLARRAIRSGNSWSAIKLIHKALITHPRIIIEEPLRTLSTFCFALISILPRSFHRMLENIVMSYVKYRGHGIR